MLVLIEIFMLVCVCYCYSVVLLCGHVISIILCFTVAVLYCELISTLHEFVMFCKYSVSIVPIWQCHHSYFKDHPFSQCCSLIVIKKKKKIVPSCVILLGHQGSVKPYNIPLVSVLVL